MTAPTTTTSLIARLQQINTPTGRCRLKTPSPASSRSRSTTPGRWDHLRLITVGKAEDSMRADQVEAVTA